jgi:protein-S-isoprenylcysteine O-methyltransferase Ste14
MWTEQKHGELQRTEGFPRRIALVGWLAAALALLVALPYGLSLLAVRHAWIEEVGPGWLNVLGLAPVAAGLAVFVWALATHYELAEDRVTWDLNASEFIKIGPYSLVRHPMYLAVVLTWFGWSAFYGSMAIFVVTLALAAVFEFVVIPREERALARRFPEIHRRYTDNVPRWIPK